MNGVSGKQSDEKWIDYPLQGTRFDVPTDEILELDDLDSEESPESLLLLSIDMKAIKTAIKYIII